MRSDTSWFFFPPSNRCCCLVDRQAARINLHYCHRSSFTVDCCTHSEPIWLVSCSLVLFIFTHYAVVLAVCLNDHIMKIHNGTFFNILYAAWYLVLWIKCQQNSHVQKCKKFKGQKVKGTLSSVQFLKKFVFCALLRIRYVLVQIRQLYPKVLHQSEIISCLNCALCKGQSASHWL